MKRGPTSRRMLQRFSRVVKRELAALEEIAAVSARKGALLLEMRQRGIPDRSVALAVCKGLDEGRSQELTKKVEASLRQARRRIRRANKPA